MTNGVISTLTSITPSTLADSKRQSKRAHRLRGTEALVQAIVDLHMSANKPLDATQLKSLQAQARGVPSSVARSAAIVLQGIPGALKKRNQALAKFGGEDRYPIAFQRALQLAVDITQYDETMPLMAKVDLPVLVEGGLELARAVDQAAAELKRPPKNKFEFTWDTPLGTIALNGVENNTYSGRSYLLIIDTGGDDHYQLAPAEVTHPISVIIDLTGNDVYESAGAGAFGAGILGYGFLLDVAGNDVYRVEKAGLGVGAFGVGMLMDKSGNDIYEARAFSEGAASFGIGVLSDLSGDDQYRCFTLSQGYGATHGCGVLVDRRGNDLYEANDTKIDYPSPQTKDHNTSLSQGFGFGLRADGGFSLAGGIGILVDGQGDDHYKCGVFGQGVSYWYSVGMLIDLEGNDTYEGIWYCQGSSAHYGVAALCDLGGNDHYTATMAQSQGAGHDYSIGLLHDVGGNNVCESPGTCLGYGCWNGIGLFWGQAGNNQFKTRGPSLGAFGDSRPGSSCIGLFVDEGGKSKFSEGVLAKPHSHWMQPANKDRPLSYGLGMAK